ncbi:MAG: HD-GYP domain-containing protein, partial [bacterium]
FEHVWHLPRIVLYLLSDQQIPVEGEDYLLNYSLNTSILSMILASDMDYSLKEAKVVAAGGLVHDIGMLKIPQFIRKKAGELTDEELEVMREHPDHGRRILEDIENLEPEVARVAMEHHEQMDGSGYPKGIQGGEIHSHARIINLCMKYIAMTQPRDYRDSRGRQETVRTMLKEEKEQFDPEVLNSFMRVVGLYPVGLFVELNSGCHAMVNYANPESPKQPRVKVFTDPGGEKIDKPYNVDLSEEPDESIKQVLIKDVMEYSSLEMA